MPCSSTRCPGRPPYVLFPLTAGLPPMGSRSCCAHSPSGLRETHHITKIIVRQKMKCIKGAGNLRPISGTQPFFFGLRPPGPLGLLKQEPAHGSGAWPCVTNAQSRIQDHTKHNAPQKILQTAVQRPLRCLDKPTLAQGAEGGGGGLKRTTQRQHGPRPGVKSPPRPAERSGLRPPGPAGAHRKCCERCGTAERNRCGRQQRGPPCDTHTTRSVACSSNRQRHCGNRMRVQCIGRGAGAGG